ncbi:ankyrin repeat domain-containing protein [Chromobacterium haemolyticum]|uniref:ankyrin repeat domain-containing protein n=1 Tax=Chromobacterium haemolyticum TaxID=394935 RepID=UPI004057A89E
MPPPAHLGKTPLFYAAEARNAPAAKLLLEQGADVNVLTRFSQMSLLMAAVLSGVPQMVADLIKHGASLEDRDKYDSVGAGLCGQAAQGPAAGYAAGAGPGVKSCSKPVARREA